jgi:hypothetical protein
VHVFDGLRNLRRTSQDRMKADGGRLNVERIGFDEGCAIEEKTCLSSNPLSTQPVPDGPSTSANDRSLCSHDCLRRVSPL